MSRVTDLRPDDTAALRDRLCFRDHDETDGLDACRGIFAGLVISGLVWGILLACFGG